MKTSDKILLYGTLTVVGLFAAVDVLHFVKYRKGETLGFKEIEKLDFVSREDTGVNWLVLDGPMRTIFYPADSLKIDVARDGAADVQFSRDGDTLKMVLDPRHVGIRSAHDNWWSYNQYVAVHIFLPALKGIRIRNGFATLSNEECRKGVIAALELDSTQCWLGSFDPEFDSVSAIEPWDSVSVRGINSNFVINKQVHVRTLDLRMDSKSEISDRFSRIDTAYIQGDTTTQLILRGRNFGRTHLAHVVHLAP